MSVEIYDKNPENNGIASEVGIQVADILIATGTRPDIAHTLGVQAAEMGAHLLLAALEYTGQIGTGAAAGHEEVVAVLADLTKYPGNASFYHAAWEAEHPGELV